MWLAFTRTSPSLLHDGLAGETSCDTLLQALDLFFSIGECFHIHARDLITALRQQSISRMIRS